MFSCFKSVIYKSVQYEAEIRTNLAREAEQNIINWV